MSADPLTRSQPGIPSRPKFSAAAAPVGKPLPLWILYPLFFTFIYFSHFTLLRLPYFWDEAGYYIPAALDFFHTGTLIPVSTITNAHPPLPSILLAAWWHLSGVTVPMATRTLVCLVSSAALLGVFRLARLLAGTAIAATVTLLTALYPVWFSQSTLAHADIFAAAFTLWALSFYLERYSLHHHSPDHDGQPGPGNLFATALLFSLAALSKETAILTPVALAAWEAAVLITEKTSAQAALRRLFALLFPILPLAAWYLYHQHRTGFMFGNPEFLRYNASANLTPARVLLSLWHRTVHLTLHMNLYVPVLCTVAVLLMPSLPGRPSLPPIRKPLLPVLLVIVLGNALAFSVLGGALLTRYLLPVYPFLLLVCVSLWVERLRQWPWLAALTALAFLAAQRLNPPYAFAPEDNLTYRDMIVLHQQAIHVLATRFPHATVLTAWPATAELEHPELGYTRTPLKVAPIENFTFEQVQKAATDPGAYDTALIFSTKWTPPPGAFNLSRASQATDTRFFDFHHDVTPAEAAHILEGEIVWQSYRNGEWAAVLHFPRSVEAANRAPGLTPARPALPVQLFR